MFQLGLSTVIASPVLVRKGFGYYLFLGEDNSPATGNSGVGAGWSVLEGSTPSSSLNDTGYSVEA